MGSSGPPRRLTLWEHGGGGGEPTYDSVAIEV